jgi:putative hemolysin
LLHEIAIVLALIAANAFFAAAEIAVVAVRKTRLQELVDAGKAGARSAYALRERPEQFLATVQIGITVVGATAAAFGGSRIAAHLAPLLARLPWIAPEAEQISLGIVIVLISYFSIVIGELVPKSLALRAAERYALLVARPLLLLSRVATPLVRFLTASSNLILKPFGDRTTFTETRFSAEELQQMVEEATRSGSVHPDAGEIASRALDLPELTAADVMVPRQQVVMLPRGALPQEIRRILLEQTHSRLPVYDGSIDNVVGYISIKDVLAVAWEHQLIILDDVMRPAHFVPESKRAVDLLREMRARHVPFAIVVDAHGGTSGIVTLEDLLEELVGEIFSEHVPSEPALIRPQQDGSVLISGNAPVRDVNRELDAELPDDGDWTTIAGLCLALAHHIPAPGEELRLDDGSVLQIVEASPRHVRTVRLRPSPPPPAPAADA